MFTREPDGIPAAPGRVRHSADTDKQASTRNGHN